MPSKGAHKENHRSATLLCLDTCEKQALDLLQDASSSWKTKSQDNTVTPSEGFSFLVRSFRVGSSAYIVILLSHLPKRKLEISSHGEAVIRLQRAMQDMGSRLYV